jgi:hypothetical protein
VVVAIDYVTDLLPFIFVGLIHVENVDYCGVSSCVHGHTVPNLWANCHGLVWQVPTQAFSSLELA